MSRDRIPVLAEGDRLVGFHQPTTESCLDLGLVSVRVPPAKALPHDADAGVEEIQDDLEGLPRIERTWRAHSAIMTG